MTGKIVRVEWIDSQVNNGWANEATASAWIDEGLICVWSVGWLVHECDEFIAICMSKFDGDIAEAMKIPKACVVNMTVLYNGN